MAVDEKLVELLKKLVSIPSVNPEDTFNSDITGERRIADFLAGYLEKKGFRVELIEWETGRPNVIGTFGPRDPKGSVMLEAHLDTVSVEGMTVPPFDPMVRDGRLYGRGACDVKGPMAASLHAMDAEALNQAAERGWAVKFVGAINEEKGAVGAEVLAERGIGADEAIVMEPTELTIVHAHKGSLWLRVTLEGRAGHGSDPVRGVNAVTGMGDLMRLMEIDILEDIEQQRSAILGSPTVNLGKIEGGSAINIIPGRCVLEIDRRYLPDENTDFLTQRISDHCEKLQDIGRITAYEVEIIRDSVPFETSPDARLVSSLAKSCRDCGVEPNPSGSAWYSDAGPFSATCGQVVVFGPGSITQAHTCDEYIELASLQTGRDILHRYLRSLS